MFEQQDGRQAAPPAALKKEADALRRQLAEKSQILEPVQLSAWKRIILFCTLMAAIWGAVYLLMFEKERTQLLAELSESWNQSYSSRGDEIFPLPPPTPKEVQPRVTSPTTFSASDSEWDGVLYSSTSPDIGGDEEEEDADEAEFVNPAKTEESQEAFQFLTENLDLARKLNEDSLAGFKLKEWQPVRIDPPLFFIDLLVTREADGLELHLIWEVDLENDSVRALSQAARDLQTQTEE